MKLTAPDFSPTEQLLEVERNILQDIKRARQEGVKAGMLDPKGPYELYVRQRGKLSKRKEKTLNPKFMTIGTNSKPTEYEYITGGSWETVVDAALDAYNMLIRRAPIRSGNYVGNMNLYVNGRITTRGGLRRVNDTENASIDILNVTEYATALEHGFYVGRYDNGRYKGSGIFLQVTREIRRKYGNSISLRFYFTRQFGGTFPAIEIAPAGKFAGNDAKPGRGTSRRRR